MYYKKAPKDMTSDEPQGTLNVQSDVVELILWDEVRCRVAADAGTVNMCHLVLLLSAVLVCITVSISCLRLVGRLHIALTRPHASCAGMAVD
jgi:hypothetical protein